jgi:hypothetical protein
MGIVCNNVLHDRAAFTDSPAHRRLILRGRFYEPVAADTVSAALSALRSA